MQTVETERLILRPFREGDAADLFAYLRAPTVPCFLSLKLADLAEAEIEVRKRALDEGCVAICLKQTGQVIGDLFGGTGEDDEDNTASVCWNLNPQFGGQGYALEAASALFEHLFRAKRFRRLYAYVEDHNIPSQRLCEKLECEGKACSSNSCHSPKTMREIRSTRTPSSMPSCAASGCLTLQSDNRVSRPSDGRG
jgi:ribosomal-protein-alanine N-acetyltransferase